MCFKKNVVIIVQISCYLSSNLSSVFCTYNGKCIFDMCIYLKWERFFWVFSGFYFIIQPTRKKKILIIITMKNILILCYYFTEVCTMPRWHLYKFNLISQSCRTSRHFNAAAIMNEFRMEIARIKSIGVYH